ncbi:adenylate kinase, partial [Candidatus Marinamargulisbacteria bacterium SCGC AG-439-L15]
SDKEQSGIILDGFPRTLAQAEALDQLLLRLNLGITHVFLFDISLDTAIDRISGRRTCPDTHQIYHVRTNPPPSEIADKMIIRSDDTEEKVRHRYEVYQNQTAPLVQYYQDTLITIDAENSASHIFDLVVSSLGLACQA